MSWHVVPGAIGDRDDPGVISTEVEGVAILLVFGGGRWWAIEDRCSHSGCVFSDDGEIDGLIAVCNCHGSEFDVRTGQALAMPAKEPIRTFPARLKDETLQVRL